MRWWLAIGAALGVAAWWFFGDDEAGGVTGDLRQVFRDAINGITQGRRLTHAPYDKATGIAPGEPQSIADAMGATLDEAALARNIASEQGGASTAAQALVAHATKNEAARRGMSIASLLLQAKSKYDKPGTDFEGSNSVPHSGRFGTQANLEVWVTKTNGDRVHPSDRYATTSQDAYEGHLAVARGVLSGAIPDLTGGANQYDNTEGLSDPDALARRREAAGSERVDLSGLGIDLDDLEFWRQREAV
jgi:hypothetical protein